MPPVTRTTTGKLPVARKHVDNETSVPLSDTDSDGRQALEPNSSTSEARAHKSAKPIKTTVASSQRESKNAKPQGLSRRKQGRLRDLPTMPLDILFEIFSYLLPEGLVNLSRATKSFRKVLVSRQSAWLWKASFANAPDIPPCPEDMSEPAWANLLFGGGSYCHSCDSKSVSQMFFMLRRRACKACKDQHLSKNPTEFLQDAPVCRSIIYSIPYVGCAMCLPPCENCHSYNALADRGGTTRWWDEDVISLRKEVFEVSRKFSAGSRNMKQAMRQLIVAKKAAFKARQKHVRICEAWVREKRSTRDRERYTLTERRLEQITSRCIELGYTASDVDSIQDHKEVKVAKVMSDKVWQRIRPILVPLLDVAKTRRLAKEKQARTTKRWAIFRDEYLTHMQTLSVTVWSFLPSASERDIRLSEGHIQDLMQTDTDGTEEFRQQVQAAMPTFVTSLRALTEEHKKALCTLLPNVAEQSEAAPSNADSISGEKITVGLDRLELATSVFVCRQRYSCRTGHAMVGLEAVAHRCERHFVEYGMPEFCEVGSRAVVEMLRLLQLDPSTTTTTKMDRLYPLFICVACKPSKTWDTIRQDYVVGWSTMSWRGCVDHAQRNHVDFSSQQLLLKLLTDEESEPIRTDRQRYGYSYHWGCMHCVLQTKSPWLTHESIVKHVISEHGIQEPLLDQDIFRDYREPYWDYRVGVIAEQPVEPMSSTEG